MALKGMNIKAFFSNHLEKVALGLIAFLVLCIWGKEFFAGNWSRERRIPADMLNQITEKRKEIDTKTWPQDLAQSFELVDFSERAQTLLSPINATRYDLSTELFVPLYKPKEKAREPDLMIVEDLQADFGHVILAMRNPESELRGLDVADNAPAQEEMTGDEEDEEFVRRKGTGQSGAAGSRGGTGIGSSRLRKKGDDDDIATHPLALGGGKSLLNRDKSPSTGLGSPGEAGRSSSNSLPEGHFFVAVRGVWPVNAQLDKFIKALHLSSRAEAERYLDIIDFELERQVAAAGDDPWSKPWEKLDAQRAVTILDEADGFDLDPVDMQIVDVSITMSLPRRILGEWKSVATHPRITNFVLSDEEIEKERQIQEKLNEQLEKLQLEEEKNRGPVKRGFSRTANDYRGMAQEMNRQQPGTSNEFWKSFSTQMRNQQPGGVRPGPGMTEADLERKVTAAGALMLFRYLDFDVQPGFAYRYRVRLTIRNPNYQKEIVDVVDPSVAEGGERITPWSKTSNATVLPVSPTYFLHAVDRQPMLDDVKNNRRGVADIKQFEWHSKLGTRVASVLELVSLGQFLGGEKRVKVLDVGTEVIKEEPYKFSTEDLLLDVEPDLTLLSDDHPDLGLPKSKKEARIGLSSEALVVDRGGEIQVVEESVNTKEEKRLQSLLERERRDYTEVEKNKDADANPLNRTAGGLGEANSTTGKQGKATNPRKKTKRQRSASKSKD